MRRLIICGVISAMILVFVMGASVLSLTSAPVVEANPGTQWNATYFNQINLTGGTISRVDDSINFNWAGGSPDPAIPADNFSARLDQNRRQVPQRREMDVPRRCG